MIRLYLFCTADRDETTVGTTYKAQALGGRFELHFLKRLQPSESNF